VAVDDGVWVRVGVAVGGGGKIWFTTVCPKAPVVIATIASTPEMINHCQPVAMYAWRVR
jgi:hypothetical protein